MESLETTSALLVIQYDTGCQFSLISKSALQLVQEDSYSLGNSSRINILDFTGQGQLFNATEVKLNLFNIALKLVIVDANLDSESAYLFPTPPKWRANTGHNVTSHSGRVSNQLGGDNFLYFLNFLNRAKDLLSSFPELVHPCPDAPISLSVHASNTHLGSVLQQLLLILKLYT